MKLVIVESPNKKATIKKYLGEGYEVFATAGHFRDLPKKDLGVDLETFVPTYEVSDEKKHFLAAIKKAAAGAEDIFLGSDADREGEAIAWHLVDELRLRGAKRIRFTEITPKALAAAVAAAGPLDMHLVDAQQARRVVDRLVGYQVSPLLSPFGKNHSAGRVQSATLHLVVQRELEREAHVVTPYWTVSATYANGLVAKYAPPTKPTEGSEEDNDARLHSEEEAQAVVARAQGPHTVTAVETAPGEKKPKAPFTTSSLQQAASVRLKLKPDATMELAQQLFEGGHISYHRSDSVAVSDEAAAMARSWLTENFPEALPAKAPVYKSKASAQGAHECIRPTSLGTDAPEGLAGPALELYRLVRTRFLASQCKPATVSKTTVTLVAGDTTWRATGTTIVFDSFLRLSNTDDDEAKGDKVDDARVLPVVANGEVLEAKAVEAKRQETKAPSRFTEAALVRAMESAGIGRPSTYAATLKTLFAREYIGDEKGFVVPTARGRLIDTVLTAAFPALVEANYTAQLESTLDDVAEGKRRWQTELNAWYGPFAQQLAAAAGLFAAEARKRPELAAKEQAPSPTGKPCPRCGKELFLRQGKHGPFLSCSAYPGCTYRADPSAKPTSHTCPKCTGPMEAVTGRFGPYARCLKDGCGGIIDLSPPPDEKCPICAGPMRDKGEFLSCAAFPACKGVLDKKALAAAKKANRTCPECKTRLLVPKKNARGAFWGCSGYPICKHIDAEKSAAPPAKKASGARR